MNVLTFVKTPMSLKAILLEILQVRFFNIWEEQEYVLKLIENLQKFYQKTCPHFTSRNLNLFTLMYSMIMGRTEIYTSTLRKLFKAKEIPKWSFSAAFAVISAQNF